MNATIQVFTFDRSSRALNLTHFMLPFFKHGGKAKVAFKNLDGQRRYLTVTRPFKETAIRQLNEGHISVPASVLMQNPQPLGVQEIWAHLSVSPSSALWAAPKFRDPNASHTARSAASAKVAESFRKNDPVATVLEVTLKTSGDTAEKTLINVCSLAQENLGLVDCEGVFAVVDVGDDWLFFPKSGYNPNTADLQIYFRPGLHASWAILRRAHNASIERSTAGSSRYELQIHCQTKPTPKWTRR